MSLNSNIFSDFIRLSCNKGVNFLLPARCIVTGEIVESSEMLSPDAWAMLTFIGSPLCDCCGMPFDVFEGGEEVQDMMCSLCLDHPPAYENARAALRYDEESRSLLLAYKHGDKTHMALPFSQWMLNAGQDMLDSADLIVPVPLHWMRLVKRRYNQAALLAQCLSKKINIPSDTTRLKRVKATQSQGHMALKDRQKNVKSAFVIGDKDMHFFKEKRIVLVDDVYTTGSTVNECAKTLLKAEAKSVQVLTVARTVYL